MGDQEVKENEIKNEVKEKEIRKEDEGKVIVKENMEIYREILLLSLIHI